METKGKLKHIFSMKLAGFLMMNGFSVIGVENDLKGSGRKVFLFKDTPELETMVGTYLKIYGKKEKRL